MKIFAMILLGASVSAFATIPQGKYKADKIVCAKSGKVLKMGGDPSARKPVKYDMFLDVTATELIMTVDVVSAGWGDFRMKCKQVNRGAYVYTKENTYEGELKNTVAKCNSQMMERYLKSKLFGVEEYGEFTYNVSGSALTIFNTETVTKYSCTEQANDYPIYYYNKL